MTTANVEIEGQRRKPMGRVIRRAMSNALEEEFFAVEGRPQPGGNAACAYVAALEAAPNGDSISAEERAALWYLAFWSVDGVTHPSLGALGMHLDLSSRATRTVLFFLVQKGILRWRIYSADPSTDPRDSDVYAYEFVELRG
jgi:hypothetical protein